MKKLLRFASVALLTGALMVACDDDDAVTPVAPAPVAPAPIFGSVSGTVSVEGSGLPGVSVNLVGAASQSATTGSSGGYSFGNVPTGTHGVQISGAPADVAFVSTATVVTISTSGQTATADFSGNYIRTSSITGSVTAGGEGVVATVTATGGGMLMSEQAVVGSSDTNGDFALTGLRAGTYHVAISDFGDIEFHVTTRDVTVGVGLSANVSFSADGPPTGTGLFLIITGVTDDDGDDDKTSGRVTATIDIDRGDARFEKVALYVDGTEVASQSFGLASASAEEPELAAQQVVFSLSFNSDEFDQETGAVTYPNGDHAIVAGVTTVGSEAEDYSQRWDVELENDDGYVVTADLGDNSEIGDAGRRWYGGPDNGTIDITALFVSYSGGSVTSVVANFCGENKTDAEAPYAFEFECEDRESNTDGTDDAVVGEMLAISSAGEDGKILGDNPFPAFVDFAGPTGSPIIVANPNGREMGWINSAVSLSAERKKATDDALLIPGADSTGGIGGYNMVVRVGKDLKAALAAAVASSVPAESASAGSYCAVAMATDDLGNESPAADSTATCRAAPAGADALFNHDSQTDPDGMTTAEVWGNDDDDQADNNTAEDADLSVQHLVFGVDDTAPVIELAVDDGETRFDENPGANAIAFDVGDDESNLGNSGLLEGGGIFVSASRRTASKTECPVIAENGTISNTDVDKDCESTAITDDDVDFEAVDLVVGYYTVSGMAKDKAGNTSGSVSHTLVYDDDAAEATDPAIPGVVAAGKPFQGGTYLNDNLSLRDYYGTMNYGTVASLGIGRPVAVDGFNASSFTRLNHAVNQPVGIVTTAGVVDPYAALQAEQGSGFTLLNGVAVFVRDQAGDYGPVADAASTTVAPTGAPAVDTLGFRASGTVNYTVALDGGGGTNNDDIAICGYAECTEMADVRPTSVKLEFEASRTQAGTFRDPIERVDFWVTDVNGASWLLGSDASGTSGRVGGTTDSARYRTWSYSITVPSTLIRALTRPDTNGDQTPLDPRIRAIAVNKHGVGLDIDEVVTFGTEKDDN